MTSAGWPFRGLKIKLFLCTLGIGTFVAAGPATVGMPPPPGNLYCPSLTYKGVEANLDSWCQLNCSHFHGNGLSYLTECPSAKCKCADPGEQPNTSFCFSPRSCGSHGSDGAYEAVPGSSVTDVWCQAQCTTRLPNCPCTQCRCKGVCRDGETMVTLTFDDTQKTGDVVELGTYQGFDFSVDALIVDPSRWNGPQKTGFVKSMLSAPRVLINRDGRPVTVSQSGTFRPMKARIGAGYKQDVELSLQALDDKGTPFGAPQVIKLSSNQASEISLDVPTAKKFALATRGGKGPQIDHAPAEDSFAMDNLQICVVNHE